MLVQVQAKMGPWKKICIKAGESTSSTRRKPALRLAQTPMSTTGRCQARVSTTTTEITIQHLVGMCSLIESDFLGVSLLTLMPMGVQPPSETAED
jgi:hypothetical protein